MLNIRKTPLTSGKSILASVAMGVGALFILAACRGEMTPAPTVDTTLPDVEVVSPEDGATVEGTAMLQVEASDNNEVTEVRYSLDGSEFQSLTFNDGAGVYEAEIETGDLYRGTHHVTVDAEDARGNVNRALTSIVVDREQDMEDIALDRTQPAIEVISPEERVPSEGSVMLSVKATDDVEVADVRYSLDGSEFQSLTFNEQTQTYEAEFMTEGLYSGIHFITIDAEDATGNVNREAVSIVVEDRASEGTA